MGMAYTPTLLIIDCQSECSPTELDLSHRRELSTSGSYTAGSYQGARGNLGQCIHRDCDMSTTSHRAPDSKG